MPATLEDIPRRGYTTAAIADRMNALLPLARAGRNIVTYNDAAGVLADTSTGLAEGTRLLTAQGHAYRVAAASASDHHVTNAGGVKLYVLRSGPHFQAEAFGIVGDGVTDNTARYEVAFGAVNLLGGYLAFGPGTFLGTMQPRANSRLRVRGVIGARTGTTLRAATDGAFAAILRYQSGHGGDEFTFRDVTLDGTGTGGVTKRRCGVWYEIRCDFEAVEVRRCAIGVARQNAYYSVFRDCKFTGNDVGLFVGTRPSGTQTLAGLLDGSGAAVSITMTVPDNANGHSGNFLMDNCHVATNRFGIVALPRSQMVTLVKILNTTVEGNTQAGLVAARSGIELDTCWFEGNNPGGTPVTLDGASIPGGGVVTVHSAYATANNANDYGGENVNRISIRGGRSEGLRSDAGSSIELRDAALVIGSSVSTADGGTIRGDEVQADNVALSIPIRRPLPYLARARPMASFVTPKTSRLLSLQPQGGSVLVAEDFAGATGFTSARISSTTALTFAQAGGVFPEQRFARIASTTDFGLNLLMSAYHQSGAYFVTYLLIRATQVLTVGSVNSSGWPGATSNQIAHPLNEWFAMGIVGRSTATTGTPRLRLQAATAAQIDFGGLQIARFPHRADAAEFLADGRFFAAEAA